jgi:hypothetical protein
MGVDQRGNLRPSLFHCLRKLCNRAIAFTRPCQRDRLRLGGCASNPRRADSDSRTFEGVGECHDRSRLTSAHAIEQQFRLAVEQLKDVPLKAAITKCHAREVSTVENRDLRHISLRASLRAFGNPDRGLRHFGLPDFLLAKSLARSGSNPGKCKAAKGHL